MDTLDERLAALEASSEAQDVALASIAIVLDEAAPGMMDNLIGALEAFEISMQQRGRKAATIVRVRWLIDQFAALPRGTPDDSAMH